jgi:hypothetical protein
MEPRRKPAESREEDGEIREAEREHCQGEFGTIMNVGEFRTVTMKELKEAVEQRR